MERLRKADPSAPPDDAEIVRIMAEAARVEPYGDFEQVASSELAALRARGFVVAQAVEDGEHPAGQRAGGTEADPTYIVPLHATDHMLRCAKNALRNHISKVSVNERAARWGAPTTAGYRVPDDEKHLVRYQAMLLGAPKPSTSCEDRLKDREGKLAALRSDLAATRLAASAADRRAGEAEAERDRMAETLRPFALEADTWADTVPDGYHSLCTEPGARVPHKGSETTFTIGDLRRARAALSGPATSLSSE